MPNTRFNWRHQYDDERDAIERERTTYYEKHEPLTQQHFTEDADINTIMRRFGVKDGALPLPSVQDPRYYGDFTDAVDYADAYNRIREATQRFMELPAKIRARFENNPEKLIGFLDDPRNLQEAVDLELVDRSLLPKPPAPTAPQPPTPDSIAKAVGLPTTPDTTK